MQRSEALTPLNSKLLQFFSDTLLRSSISLTRVKDQSQSGFPAGIKGYDAD